MPSLFTRRFTASGSLIAGSATFLALWLGLSAPVVSPVAPPTVAEQAPVASTDQATADTSINFVHQHHAHR